jgi:transcription elongation factor
LKNTINNDKFSLTVNILVKKEQGVLVGHCLELDIVATANNMRQLKKDMADLIIAQIDYAFTNNNLQRSTKLAIFSQVKMCIN